MTPSCAALVFEWVLDPSRYKLLAKEAWNEAFCHSLSAEHKEQFEQLLGLKLTQMPNLQVEFGVCQYRPPVFASS